MPDVGYNPNKEDYEWCHLHHKGGRQAIDDFSPINPYTGLPKHIYQYKHPHCIELALRGTFQFKGRKYHTVRVEYGVDGTDTLMSLDEAIIVVEKALTKLKADTKGYSEYVESGGYRKKARERSDAEFKNSVHAKNSRATSTSVENLRSGQAIRHISFNSGLQSL